MGIDDPGTYDTPDPIARETEAPARPAPPAWADEATIAVPVAELFADDPEE
jgi:hypothetical protein